MPANQRRNWQKWGNGDRSLRQIEFAEPRAPTTRRPASARHFANRRGGMSALEDGRGTLLGSAGRPHLAWHIRFERAGVVHTSGNLERTSLDETFLTSLLSVSRRYRREAGTVMDHRLPFVRNSCQRSRRVSQLVLLAAFQISTALPLL